MFWAGTVTAIGLTLTVQAASAGSVGPEASMIGAQSGVTLVWGGGHGGGGIRGGGAMRGGMRGGWGGGMHGGMSRGGWARGGRSYGGLGRGGMGRGYWRGGRWYGGYGGYPCAWPFDPFCYD